MLFICTISLIGRLHSSSPGELNYARHRNKNHFFLTPAISPTLKSLVCVCISKEKIWNLLQGGSSAFLIIRDTHRTSICFQDGRNGSCRQGVVAFTCRVQRSSVASFSSLPLTITLEGRSECSLEIQPV